MEAKSINPLTSLRFFAAMWVVLFHYWPNLSPVMPGLVAKGYLGVELFFVLSGFILCHVYLDSVADGTFRYGGFLWARLARIYPLHLATLAGVGLMAAGALAAGRVIDPNILAWTSLPANLLLVQAWGFAPQAGWNHPSWSISAEWFAYLSFPVTAWAVLKLKDRPLAAVAGALVLMAGLYAGFHAVIGFPLTKATIDWGALRIIPCFVYGAAINLGWRRFASVRRSWATLGALISGAAILLAALLGTPDTLLVALFGALILSLALLTKAGANSGGGKLFVYLGEISYSIYMICIPWKLLYINSVSQVFHAQKDHLPIFLWIVFYLSVIPLAALSYHLVEHPARRWMRQVSAAPVKAVTSVA
jgi:peptidoglycan/LPS O-acetylase OafA/YrhL